MYWAVTFALTCFGANASLQYNDMTKAAAVQATPLASDAISYPFCEELQGQSFRLEVELAAETGATGNIIQHKVYSQSEIFDYGTELRITVIIPIMHRNAALSTRIASFTLRFQEITAEIRQTFASYSIAAFEFDECIQESSIRIIGLDTIIVELSTLECDIESTLFASLVNDSNPALQQKKNESVELLLVLEESGNLTRFVGSELLSLINNGGGVIQEASVALLFECSTLGDEEHTCKDIIEKLEHSPLYKLAVTLKFKLRNSTLSGHRLTMSSIVAEVYDPRYVNCYTSEYAHTSEAILLFFNLQDGDPQCRNVLHRNMIVQFLMQQNEIYDMGVHEIFEFKFEDFNENTSFISFECNNSECSSVLRELTFVKPIAKLRFMMYSDSRQFLGFFSVKTTRTQNCFGSVNATLYYEKNDVELELFLQAYDHSDCEYENSQRAVLQLFLFKRRFSKAPLHLYDRNALCMFEIISQFSIQNTSLAFLISECPVNTVSKLIETDELSAELHVNDMLLYVFNFKNEIFEHDHFLEIGIALTTAVVLGIAGFFVNWYWEELVSLRSRS